MADDTMALDEAMSLLERALRKGAHSGGGIDDDLADAIDVVMTAVSHPQGVTAPRDALEHDREVATALRQKVAELEARVAAGHAVPEGWALVPVEPTDDMCDAAWEGDAVDYIGEHKCLRSSHEVWRDMLAAAPPAPSAWRPIEEAPENEEVIVATTLRVWPARRITKGGVERWFFTDEECAMTSPPTHWMPFPAPPVAGKAGEGAEGGR